MKQILDGSTRRVGAVFNEIDTNFLEVCNTIMRLAYLNYTLRGYAITQPVAPVTGDCYLVIEPGIVWGIDCEKDDILLYNGTGYELLEHKITEINQAIQNQYFTASQITISPIAGLNAQTVQNSLAEIAAALMAAGIFGEYIAYLGTMAVGTTFEVA